MKMSIVMYECVIVCLCSLGCIAWGDMIFCLVSSSRIVDCYAILPPTFWLESLAELLGELVRKSS